MHAFELKPSHFLTSAGSTHFHYQRPRAGLQSRLWQHTTRSKSNDGERQEPNFNPGHSTPSDYHVRLRMDYGFIGAREPSFFLADARGVESGQVPWMDRQEDAEGVPLFRIG